MPASPQPESPSGRWSSSERGHHLVRRIVLYNCPEREQRTLTGDLTCLGTLFRASQFLSEELPIRLAHRVQELNELPDGLNEMPSIKKVQDWYAMSFEVRVSRLLRRACCGTATDNRRKSSMFPNPL